jgi:hypothetical protein
VAFGARSRRRARCGRRPQQVCMACMHALVCACAWLLAFVPLRLRLCTSAARSSRVHYKSWNVCESQSLFKTPCWADGLPASVSCCTEEAAYTCRLLIATTCGAQPPLLDGRTLLAHAHRRWIRE